jgi:hypothetical protein
VKAALARAGPVELAVGPARLVLAAPRFSDVTVSMDGGGRALVLAMVEADGRWRTPAEEVAISYVGREAFAMERCAGLRWCPAGVALPALAGVVEALHLGHRPEGRRPVAWQIRVERDRATVGEDGEAPDGGPAPRRLLELVREDGRWRALE